MVTPERSTSPGPTGAVVRASRSMDPVGLSASLVRAAAQIAYHPRAVMGPTARLLSGLVQASAATTSRALGGDRGGPVAPGPRDKRFADPAWSANAFFYGLLQLYLLNARYLNDLVGAVALPVPDEAKARFAAQLLADAGAPTNFLFTNPQALKRAFDTGGRSLVAGWSNFMHDLVTNGGWPSQVRREKFELGKDLAATRGKVVFRNELIELIQYEPLTPQVHAVPMLFCPPWINKYYIMDLSPGRSLVEWALAHDFTVFCISYRNPDGPMGGLSFDDYMFKGPLAAMDAVRSITGSAKVNTVSVCLGGTLNAVTVAYLKAKGQDRVSSSTYLNSLIDFSGAGTLQDVFTDEKTVEELTRRMSRHGYLEAGEMAHTFDLLRANDLVFRYVAANWLMGEEPPAFDLLAWNNDGTRMPATMHSYYLRRFYLDNALARGELEVDGTRLELSATDNGSYLVGAVNDHIVPWKANYHATRFFDGRCRFVLTSGGHVAGIVNPPGGHVKMWVNEALPASADEWLAGAREVAGTWWEDWTAWARARSGALGPPPPMGDDAHPVLADAPGTYVRG